MRRVAVGLLAAVLAAHAGAGEGRPAPGKEDPETRFKKARLVMLGGDPASAAELFRAVLGADPASRVADDCLYWRGRCLLRVKDREPDAVVAFLRLVREYPESPFVDDAARELALLGDRTAVPLLQRRARGKGKASELAVRALAEFGVEKAAPAADKKRAASSRDELAELRDEVRRLRREVEKALEMVRKLVAEKERREKNRKKESKR